MSKFLRGLFLAVIALYFIGPQLAMARFAFQSIPTPLLTWDRIFEGWSLKALITAFGKPELWAVTRTSLMLAVLTTLVVLALLVPVAVAVEIKAPKLKPWITGVTLIPWVVPPIALVVGVAGTFRNVWPGYLVSPLAMVPFYALWAMPFTYRSLDAGLRAINARTLYEAGVSLGASPGTVLRRVLVPNLVAAVFASAGLTVALVLGEFAFASLLLKETLPTYLASYQLSSPKGGMALAFVVMILTALALHFVVRMLAKRGVEFTPGGM
ncbi:MAG: ABC transporter permease subunit [Tetrasphaera sp.]|nr:ABC transporter permease subunit [Tetrasphaera sp.]